jgi:hypothetical protein
VLTLLALSAAEVVVQRVDVLRRRRFPFVPMASASALAVLAGFEWAGAIGSVVTVVVVYVAVGVLAEAARAARAARAAAGPDGGERGDR